MVALKLERPGQAAWCGRCTSAAGEQCVVCVCDVLIESGEVRARWCGADVARLCGFSCVLWCGCDDYVYVCACIQRVRIHFILQKKLIATRPSCAQAKMPSHNSIVSVVVSQLLTLYSTRSTSEPRSPAMHLMGGRGAKAAGAARGTGRSRCSKLIGRNGLLQLLNKVGAFHPAPPPIKTRD